MNKLPNLHSELLDVVSRIERLNSIEELHQSQPVPDTLALEGYQKLRQQYIEQLGELLASINIKADIHLKTA
jgi:hypothetical protein